MRGVQYGTCELKEPEGGGRVSTSDSVCGCDGETYSRAGIRRNGINICGNGNKCCEDYYYQDEDGSGDEGKDNGKGVEAEEVQNKFSGDNEIKVLKGK